jgi:hypothetical protein
MRTSHLQNISNNLLGIIWILSLVTIFIDWPSLKTLNGIILFVYILLVAPFCRKSLQVLSLALSTSALCICIFQDGWHWVWAGIEKATLFAAFFGTLSLIRATAERRPEIKEARISVNRLGGGERSTGLLAGTFLLGSTLIVGVMAIFSPIIGREAPMEVRLSAAEASQRGMCLACLWSPFWVAMAVSSEHLPDVPLWQIMLTGLALSGLGLVTAQLIYTPKVGLTGLVRAIRAFRLILLPVSLAALVVLALNLVSHLTTLQSLVLGVPLLCIASLVFSGPQNLIEGFKEAGAGLGTIRGEIMLLTCSFALGLGIQFVLESGNLLEWISDFSPPPLAIIFGSVAFMSVLAFIGIHQIVTLTVVLVVCANLPVGIDHLALMQTGLLGWSFASMIGLSAVSVAAAGTMFNIPIERLAYGNNVKFVVFFSFIGAGWIALLNKLLS